MNFSVLLSVYIKEKPSYLKKSLDSVFTQTLLPNEVVLVEDGPLTDNLYKVIDSYKENFPILKVVKSEKNQGLGKALNLGLNACSYEYVARMDTDDICFPNRFEKQMTYLKDHPEVDMVGSWTQEFIELPNEAIKYTALKRFPETNEQIIDYSKKRCAFEHPAVIFKKKAVVEAGNYQQNYLFEDYSLWVRMMINNAKFYNIQEPLLYFRMTDDSFNRRGGLKYALSEAQCLWMFKKWGFLNILEYLESICIRIPVRLLPNSARKFFYNHFLRKK